MSSHHDADTGVGGGSVDGQDEPRPRGQTTVDRSPDDTTDDSELRLLLDPTSRAAGTARQALWEWQSAFDLDDEAIQDTLMVVSELVTNAVHHADSPIEVIATMNADGVRIEVHDLLADPPVARPHDGANNGYGLRLVAQLTDRWGWRPTSSGKYVWAETSRRRLADRRETGADAPLEPPQ